MKYTILTLALLLVAHNTHAVTAHEYTEELSAGERVAYALASAEMAISMHMNSQAEAKATCVRNWMVNTPEDMMDTIGRYLANPDNGKFSAAGVIRLVFERHCAADLQPE